VLHVILCVSNFSFLYFLFFWKRVKNVGTHVLNVKKVGAALVYPRRTHKFDGHVAPSNLNVRTWVPSNLREKI
jgi:hypothetical protein